MVLVALVCPFSQARFNLYDCTDCVYIFDWSAFVPESILSPHCHLISFAGKASVMEYFFNNRELYAL